MTLFGDAFLRLSPQDIVDQLRERGYCAVERALEPQAADAILHDVDGLEVQLNRNVPPNVVFKGATYATHVLGRSQTAFRLVTDALVTGVVRGALGDEFSMTSKRAYETRGGAYMCFHSDTALARAQPERIDAVVFIFYLNDVADGEWEIVEGSHLWDDAEPPSKARDEALARRPGAAIRGFKMPKGSVVIYDGRLLHRARPYAAGDYARRSFFFQANRGLKKGEPILVETGFITPDLSDDARMLLGFGRPPRAPVFPETGAGHLPQSERRRLLDSAAGTTA